VVTGQPFEDSQLQGIPMGHIAAVTAYCAHLYRYQLKVANIRSTGKGM